MSTYRVCDIYVGRVELVEDRANKRRSVINLLENLCAGIGREDVLDPENGVEFGNLSDT